MRTGNQSSRKWPLRFQRQYYLKAECDFRNKTDTASFFYSLDGKIWKLIGTPLKMAYTMPQFMGYRFGLFNYATKTPGGYVDFDWFRTDLKMKKLIKKYDNESNINRIFCTGFPDSVKPWQFHRNYN